MASIWMVLDDVPPDDFVPSIVVPLIRALGNHGLHANLEATENRIIQNQGTLAYAMFPGGELSFVYTTGPTFNPISGSIDTWRYMLAEVRGIPDGLGITESDVDDAIREFQWGLWEREIYGGRPQIKEGRSLGGKFRAQVFSHSPSPPFLNRGRGKVAGQTEPSVSKSRIGVTETSPPGRSLEPGQQPRSPDETGNASVGKKRGCYIATAVYGGYDGPQVRILRRFRDESLGASHAGRLMTRMYYRFSPAVVRCIGDRAWFMSVARPVLDAFASRLRARGTSDAEYTDPE